MLKVTGLIVATALLASTSAASAQSSKRAVTPSGRPDMVFRDTPSQDAIAKLANTCMDLGISVVETTPNSVTCEAPMGMAQSVIAQALIGNSYSTKPQQFIRFNVAQIQNDTRVQGSARVQTQMAFGQMRTEDLTDDATYNGLMVFMEASGAEFLPGTSFHNYPFIGTGGTEAIKVVHKGRSTLGLVLRDLVANGPLHNAGAAVGDIIVEINGKTFRNDRDFDKRLRAVPFGTSFDVTVLRNGEHLYISLVSAPRPTVGEDGGRLALLSEVQGGQE